MICTKDDAPYLNEMFSRECFWKHIKTRNADERFRHVFGTVLLHKPDIYILKPCPGVIVFCDHLFSGYGYAVHIFALPECRGEIAVQAAKLAISFLFEVIKVQKLMAFVPAENRAVRWFTNSIGFQKEGVSKNSYFEGDKITDRIIYGISKEDYYEFNW